VFWLASLVHAITICKHANVRGPWRNSYSVSLDGTNVCSQIDDCGGILSRGCHFAMSIGWERCEWKMRASVCCGVCIAAESWKNMQRLSGTHLSRGTKSVPKIFGYGFLFVSGTEFYGFYRVGISIYLRFRYGKCTQAVKKGLISVPKSQICRNPTRKLRQNGFLWILQKNVISNVTR
jgi:hypothetical protein